MEEPVEFGIQELDMLADYTELGVNTLEAAATDRNAYLEVVGSGDRDAPENAFEVIKDFFESEIENETYETVSEYLWEQGEMVSYDNPWREAGYEWHFDMIEEAQQLEMFVKYALGKQGQEPMIDEQDMGEHLQLARNIDDAVGKMYGIM